MFSALNIIVFAVLLQSSLALVEFSKSQLYDEYDFAVSYLDIPSYGSRIYVSIPDSSSEIAKNIILHDYVRDEISLYDISKMKNGNEKGYYEVEAGIQQVRILNMNPGNATALIAVWAVQSDAQGLPCSKVFDAANLTIVADWQPSAELTVMGAEPFTLRSTTEGPTRLYTFLGGFDVSEKCNRIFYQMDPYALNDYQVYVQSPLISLSFDVSDYKDSKSTVRADVGIGNSLDFSGMSFVASPGNIGCDKNKQQKTYRSSLYGATTSFNYFDPSRKYNVDISSALNTDINHPVTIKDNSNGKEFKWYGTTPDITNGQNITIQQTNMRCSSLLPFLLLFSSVYTYDICPSGYTLAPNGGDCYQLKVYYDSFMNMFIPKTYDQVELDCNEAPGGLLASIHSHEDENFIQSLVSASSLCSRTADTLFTNIGLRCVGKSCKWDDGSPVTYTNFDKDPIDDGQTRCYGQLGSGRWVAKSCTKEYQSDCWACSVKALADSFRCQEGETYYKGGCVSVHKTPLDQKSAEASCPGGGHLISIHGFHENNFYLDAIYAAGVTGTAYIGGQFPNAKYEFEWLDGSYYNYNQFAMGFPNTILGSCVQLLLASDWGIKGQWTNVDCTTKQPYICFQPGPVSDPTALPLSPNADANCPAIQYFNGSGSVYSPNYPIMIPNQQTCQYVLTSKEGTKAKITFPAFNCRSGTTLSIYDGLDSDKPFITFTTNSPPPNKWYTVTSNVIKMVFAAYGSPVTEGTGWEAEFTGV